MLLFRPEKILPHLKINHTSFPTRFYGSAKVLMTQTEAQELLLPKEQRTSGSIDESSTVAKIFPPATTHSRVMPLVLPEREAIVLPFDDVPGPGSLKLLAKARHYLSSFGTQLTASCLTLGVNFGAAVTLRKSSLISSLFDQYGPVVRFVSPIGEDIILINNPDHIQKVFAAEGDYPVRSTLDCLEAYRKEYRNVERGGGLFNLQGPNWRRNREMFSEPMQNTIAKHFDGFEDVCNSLVNKIYNTRNTHDELKKDLYKEIYKWSFDCMGYLIFSKKFTMLDTEIVYSQCDMSWLFHNFVKATEAIMKCESGFQLWKLVPTFAWKNLCKHCDNLENLIGKYVLEAEQKMIIDSESTEHKADSLITCLLKNEAKLTTEDITTILMDMLLIGVNTVSSATSFLLYNLAKHQKYQKKLYQEIVDVEKNAGLWNADVYTKFKDRNYLQACIKETLRLVPPIPLLTRVLPRNVTLDRYNIPRGTLVIMSMADASLKESNFDDADRFNPERWLQADAKEYHNFATIPFGFGARKCVGQFIAETMMSLVTYKLLQKFKLEYHYGDINPTNTFIVKPDKPLKIRFIDRVE